MSGTGKRTGGNRRDAQLVEQVVEVGFGGGYQEYAFRLMRRLAHR